jgi:dipeptidyl aminopeptidase/acylaminoacyl peptidase
LENLRLDDFTNYKFLSGIQHSPDGRRACFVVHQADLDSNEYRSHLWLYNLENESCLQLTGLGKERSFAWLNDDEILFSALRNPKDQERQKKGEEFTVFYKISVHGGEAVEAFRVPRTVLGIKPMPGERFLLTCVYNPKRPDLSTMSEQDKAEELKKREEEKSYEVLEEIPYWSNGRGFVSGSRSRLYLYDLGTNSLEPLTGELMQVTDLELNLKKDKAVFAASEYSGMAKLTNSLYLADLDDKSVRRITPEDEQFYYWEAHFLSDQELICLGTSRERYGLNENPLFYLVNLEDGTNTLITPGLDVSVGNSVGSDCRYGGGNSTQVEDGHLYFVTTEGFNSYLNRIDRSGSIEKVATGDGSIDSFSVKNGSILFLGLRGSALQELYAWQDGEERRLTAFNVWVQQERRLSQPEHLSFETAPGVTIDGWVLKPVDYQEGQSYPAILDIHGGPKTVYGTVFFHEMQYWANQGYFVLFCNPRGSDGKGNEFADIRGKYGTIDYDDIMRFTDLVLERYPSIDRARVGVTGGSYGGYMTNWIIGHTRRFKAAASQRSISNWFSMGYTTDIGYFFTPDQVAATPWSDPEKLWEHSPLKYAHQVQTPTLFIHSDEDYRCWLPEGLQMFTALKYHGVEARLCLFKGENHELSRSGKPKARIRRLEEITNWFDRFLKS